MTCNQHPSSLFSAFVNAAPTAIIASSSTPAQSFFAAVRTHILQSVARLVFPGVGVPYGPGAAGVTHSDSAGVDAVPPCVADHVPVGYGFPTPAALPIVADLVALPDSSPPLPLLRHLPPELATQYGDLSSVLRLVPPAPERLLPARAFGRASQYHGLLRRLLQLDMVDFVVPSTLSVRAVNGVFCVPKSGSDVLRLIIAAQNANAFFVDALPVELITPAELARLQLSGRTFMGKCDLDSFFYRFAVPEHWLPFFALPFVSADAVGLADRYGAGARLAPRFKRLAMGFSHAVVLTQSIHAHILAMHQSPLAHYVPLSRGRSFRIRIGDLVFIVYIDDVVVFCSDPARINALLDALVHFYESIIGLVVKRSKVARAALVGEALGLEFDGERGTLAPAPAKLRGLMLKTVAVLQSARASSKMIERLLGAWVWFLLVRRPMLSFLSAVFRFVVRGFPVTDLWPSVCIELSTIAALAPLAVARLTLPTASEVWCSDSCLRGGATMVAPLSPRVAEVLSELCWSPPKETHDRAAQIFRQQLLAHPWSVVLARPWRLPQHINTLELKMVQAVLCGAIARGAFDQRIFSFCDNQSVVAALAKGRSSSPSLARHLRRLAVWLFLTNVDFQVHYVDTASNPSDEPSRAF